MKKVLLIALLSLFAAFGVRAQSTTTFSITVQAPPSCTVTLAANPVSTSGSKLYSGQAGVINFNISACSIAGSSATATWDGAATPTNFVAGPPAALSVPVSAAQATVGTHSLVLTIPFPVLSMTTPVTLPNAQVGVIYSANLASLSGLTGGTPPYNFSLDPATPLPSGLTLSSSGIISGTPTSSSGTGSLSFNFTVADSSGA